MKTLLLFLYIITAGTLAANAQSKTSTVSEPETAPVYGKYVEIQPVSYITSANGRKISLQHNPKRTDPVAQPQDTDPNRPNPARVEGKLIADAADDRNSIGQENLNKGK